MIAGRDKSAERVQVGRGVRQRHEVSRTAVEAEPLGELREQRCDSVLQRSPFAIRRTRVLEPPQKRDGARIGRVEVAPLGFAQASQRERDGKEGLKVARRKRR